MPESKFKVGQQWKNRQGQVRTITKIQDTNHTNWPMDDDKDFSYMKDGKYYDNCLSAYDLLELVKDVEDEKVKEELKLEVGNKYKVPFRVNPCELIVFDEGDYIFREKSGNVFNLKKADTEGIKEHREPIKNTVTKWVNFNSKRSPDFDVDIDRLLNLYTDGDFYDSQGEAYFNADDYCKDIARVEITITEK